MIDDDLDKVNEARRRKRLPPLSRPQAENAIASAAGRQEPGFDINWFLIGLIINSSTDEPKYGTSEPSPSYSTPDTSSSSYSSDSGSSSFSDSGSGSSSSGSL
jgi:hypothetical protein